MPYAYLGASAGTAAFSANAGTTSITYSGGESVIVTMSVWGGGPVVSPTLTDGTHTYIYIGSWGEHQTLWYCHNLTAGTYTLNYGAASDNVGSLRAYRFSGIQGAPIVSAGQRYFGAAAGPPNNVPVGSPDVSTVPALLFAVTRKQNDSTNVGAGTGFTLIPERLLHTPTPGTINGGAMHRRVTSAGAVSTAFSVTPDDEFQEYNSALVAFAEVVAAPQPRLKPAWASLYGRGGGRDIVRMVGKLPTSKAAGRIGVDALFGQPVATNKPVKVWNGSTWVTKPAKVWNGSAWVTKPAKVWVGSAWL